MIKREAKAHMAVEAWVRYYLENFKDSEGRASCAVELKHTRGSDRFYFRELKEHQLAALLGFIRGLIWKFDDAGYRKKPFDIIGTIGGAAFLAIQFPNVIAIIERSRMQEDQISITENEAIDIAFETIRLK